MKTSEKSKMNNVGAGPVSAHKEKGITLVALIITIIVMLILVGVSVQVVINSDLIGTAQDAANRTKTAYEEEGSTGKITIGDKTYESMEQYLKASNIKLAIVNNPETVTADGTKVKAIKEGAPIPVDFYYVGGTKNTGIVISDSSADENKGVNAELVGNQFVWVPVLQNQKLKIEIESEEEITGIKIEDPLYNEIITDKDGENLSPSGRSYSVEVNPTVNGVYRVTVIEGEESYTQTIKVSSLYAQDFFTEQLFSKALIELEAMAKEYNMTADELLATGVLEGVTSLEELHMGLAYQGRVYTDATIDTYANSVNKYGGFYIARFEAGSENLRSSSSGTTATVYSKKNMYPYNYISQTEAKTKASGMYTKTNVTSSLVNAVAWDRTLNWLVETKVITDEELVDSTSWGNYGNSTFSFSGKCLNDNGTSPKPAGTAYLLGTGVTEYTKRNNIYDLAGNCAEWIIWGGSESEVACRGGSYLFDGSEDSASLRYSIGAKNSDFGYSFRPALYINANWCKRRSEC